MNAIIRPGLYRDRNLLLIYGVTLMVVLGVSSVSPALPALMAAFTVGPEEVGLVVSAFTLPGAIFGALAAVLADRFGRKRTLTAALVVFGVCGATCAFADSFRQLLVLRFFQGTGAGLIGVLNATILGDLYHGRERAAAMGYLGGALSLAMVLFPVLGGALAQLGWRHAFFLPILALPLAGAVHFLLDNPEPARCDNLAAFLRGALDILGVRNVLVILAASFLTLVVIYGPFFTWLPILASRRFAVSPLGIGGLFTIASLAMALVSWKLGALSARFGDIALLRTAGLLYLTSMLLFPLAPSPALLAGPLVLFGLAQGLGVPTLLTLLSSLAPIEGRAVVMSANGVILRLGQTAAPLIMGAAFGLGGFVAVYGLGAAFAAAMFALALRIVKGEH